MTPAAHLTEAVTSLSRPLKQSILLGLDLAAALSAAALVSVLLPSVPLASAHLAVVALVPIASASLGLHKIKLNTFGSDGILRSAGLALFATIAARALARLAGSPLPDLALILFALLFLLSAVAFRWALLHLYLALIHHRHPRSPVILYGAGSTGLQLAAALRQSRSTRPIAFLDDNPSLQGMTLAGLRVHPPAALPQLLAQHDATRVILAMPRLTGPRQHAIVGRLLPLGVSIQTVPSFDDLLSRGMACRRCNPFPRTTSSTAAPFPPPRPKPSAPIRAATSL